VWTFDPAVPIAPVPTPTLAAKAFDLMDRWLSAIEKDHRNVPKLQKVRDDKPADATDKCFAGDQELPASSCSTVYPYYSTPRLEAGEPLRNDNVMCRLKPLSRSDYKVTFTDAEWAQLRQAFPTGVCDWSKPAQRQQPAATWLTYETGPGGTRLDSAPASVPFGGGASASGASAVNSSGLPNTGGTPALAALGALAVGTAVVLHRRSSRSRSTS